MDSSVNSKAISNAQIVLVQWWDILGEDQTWSTAEEVMQMKPAPITTIGQLIHENDEYILVSSSWDEGGEHLGNVNCIPKGVIRGMQRMSIREPDQEFE